MKPKQTDYNKARSIRLTDEVWKKLQALKPRGKDWNLFLEELMEHINYFKKL